MTGLLQRQMPAEPAQAQPSEQAPPMGSEQSQPAPGGGEQEMYNVLVEGMLGYLYDTGMESVETKLAAEENPVLAMAGAMAYIMVAVIAMLEHRGKTVPPHVMAQAGMELADNIGQVADAMGLVSVEDDLAIEMAYFIALDAVGDEIPDNPPGIKQQYKAIAETLRNERLAMLDPNEVPPELRDEIMAMQTESPEVEPQQAPGLLREEMR